MGVVFKKSGNLGILSICLYNRTQPMPLKSKGLISELSGKIKTLIVRNSVLGRINTLEYFLRPL